LTDGRTAIRFKPLGIVCGDCHSPHGSRKQRGPFRPLSKGNLERKRR
jgi:hypothetical protein